MPQEVMSNINIAVNAANEARNGLMGDEYAGMPGMDVPRTALDNALAELETALAAIEKMGDGAPMDGAGTVPGVPTVPLDAPNS